MSSLTSLGGIGYLSRGVITEPYIAFPLPTLRRCAPSTICPHLCGPSQSFVSRWVWFVQKRVLLRYGYPYRQ